MEGEVMEEEYQEEYQEEPEQEQELQDESLALSEAEEKAMKMGWVPKDEFKGDPNNWRPAEEFVERGENMIPIIRKNLSKAEQRAKAAEDKANAALEHMKLLRNKLHEREVANIEKAKREAVANGDTDTYDRLSSETPDLPEFKEEEIPKGQKIMEEWLPDNPWYGQDYEKTAEADKYGEFLARTRPDLVGTRDYLEEVAKHISEKFSNQNRKRPAAVDSGTPKASTTAGSLFSKLDNEAKATFNMMVTRGIFSNTKEDKESYAKDVLA